MPFESTVGTSDLVIGQEYFGSIVVRVKQEVTDDPENGKYKIKRFVTLKTGMILIEEYIKTMGSGKVENKEYGNAARHETYQMVTTAFESHEKNKR